MTPDDYQRAWQAQSSQTPVTVDANLLLKEVQRNQRDFRAIIARRDILEVGTSLLLLPLWVYLGLRFALPWTWYLTVPALLWLIGFMLVDRMRHSRRPTEPGDPLLKTVKESLSQLEHQMWLLRNVFWWYQLPFAISMLAFVAHSIWRTSHSRLETILGEGFLALVIVGANAFIYAMNQRAVRLQLEPRREELLALLASFADETPEQSVA